MAESATPVQSWIKPMRMPTVARVTMSAFSRRMTMRTPLTRLSRTQTHKEPSTRTHTFVSPA